MICKWWLITVLMVSTTTLFCQFDGVNIDDIVDETTPISEEELDTYNRLLEQPLVLNNATENELHQLVFLTKLQIQSIIDYRKKYGNFISKYELQAVPFLNISTIKKILPLIRIKEDLDAVHLPLKKQLYRGKHLLYTRLTKKQEDLSPNLFARYNHNYENSLSYGITAEHDANEPFAKGINKHGFDFYSAHFYKGKLKGAIKNFIVGDYSLHLGEGLLHSHEFNTQKSSLIHNVEKRNSYFKPYKSTRESGFERGTAMSIKFKKIQLLPFISVNKIDANIENDSITSLPSSGYHITASEQKKKRSTTEKIAGINITYNINQLTIGKTFYHHSYYHPTKINARIDNQFISSNQKNNYSSFNYKYTVKNLHLFGEMAHQYTLKGSLIQGATIAFDQHLSTSIVYRNYHHKYNAPHATSFGESNEANNEQGIYIGANLNLNQKISIVGYTDFWKNKWLKYNIGKQGYGNEQLVRFNYHNKRKHSAYLQYKQEQKPITYSAELLSSQIRTTQEWRLNLEYYIQPNFTLRNRISYKNVQIKDITSIGTYISQDLIYKPKDKKLSFTARIAIFDTDDYLSRIYAYENDVLLQFSVPAYQGIGVRYYLNARYKLSKQITLEARCAQTSLKNEETSEFYRKYKIKFQTKVTF